MSTTLKSINPANGEVVGEVPVTPAAEIPQIVARGRSAQAAWAALPLQERCQRIQASAQPLLDRVEELALLMTREMGKPIKSARAEVSSCGTDLETVLDEIQTALAPQTIEDARTRSVIYRDPYGVCGAISPWNFPMLMPFQMVIPALAAGNAVVCKPSEETPLIAQAYVDLLNEHLPEHVLQIVHGADDQGKALVKEVDLIAFTGSREAGKHILAAASDKLTRVVLELGGKDPMIVLKSADLDAAARFAVRNSFRNSGQVCVSTERIYVEDDVAEAFESKVVELTRQWKVGDATGDVDAGPMINARQRDHVLHQLTDAVEKGAKIIAGGEGHHDNYIMPTVLTNLTSDMEIMRDETFGPVACIVRFDDPNDAVQAANDTRFGLGATVFGDDTDATTLDVARRLTAGMIGINKSCGGAEGTPWVGANESGYGFHSSPEGHRQFTQARMVSLPKR